MFCTYFKFSPFPATEEVLALYAQFLSRSFKSAASIRNYIAGIRVLHNILDLEFPKSLYHLKLGLKGIEKGLAHCPNRVKPMTPDILGKIASVLNFSLKRACLYLVPFLVCIFSVC